MKKLISLLLTVVIALTALVACGESNPASINGTSVDKFAIVYAEDGPSYNKTAAEYIRDAILEATGAKLDIIKDSQRARKHEILVGETSRPLSEKLNADTDGLEFAILADEKSIALEGKQFVIAAAAYYFTKTYITGEGFTALVPQTVTINEPITEAPKNFIFLIGDGMGLYQTKLFDHVKKPSSYTGEGENAFYGYMLPYQGRARTNSLTEGEATDSAAAGTALATGYKTYNGYIGIDKDKNEIMSLTELAASLGKATAVMSTEELTGATPAAFSAHADSRHNDLDIEASQAKLNGTILDSVGNIYKNETIDQHINGTLDKLAADEDGFFIMYEEAHIDKNCHDNNMTFTFKSVLRFNHAIGKFMEFAFYNPDTFVIITADHETGDLRPDSEGGKPEYHSTAHSQANVLTFAYGMGAELFNGVTVENVQIPKTIAKMWGNDSFGDPASGFDALGE